MFYKSIIRNMSHILPDKVYISLKYRMRLGNWPNLKNPITYNEKLQWLKLYDRKPEYSLIVDKYEVKRYIADRIGKQYVIPTLGVWDNFNDIDFDELPNKFVLKCTHDSGGLVICRDKTKLDIELAKKRINSALKQNYYWQGREWPYKNVKPRIIAEQYMEDMSAKKINDYKLFTFDDVAKALFIDTDTGLNGDETRFDFFNFELKRLSFADGHLNSEVIKSEIFGGIKYLLEKLSSSIPNLRAELYEVNKKAYFIEITFSKLSATTSFDPREWDEGFGTWIKVPNSFGGGYTLIADGFVLWIHEQDYITTDGLQKEQGLLDYKFMCFSGEVKALFLDIGVIGDGDGHAKNYYRNIYDRDGNLMPFRESRDNYPIDIILPDNYMNMVSIAEQLSYGYPHLRVDLYNINGQIKVGELTFFHGSGFTNIFIPNEWDITFGSWIKLQ